MRKPAVKSIFLGLQEVFIDRAITPDTAASGPNIDYHRVPDWPRGLLIVLATALLAIGVVGYPLGMPWLVAAIALYSMSVMVFPRLPIVLVPAVLPVLDLAPLTGRFFLDEFDLLLLTTLILAQCRSRTSRTRLQFPRFGAVVFGLFVLSAMIAIGRGMLPLAWPDLNAFSNYYSAFNGLRATKGLLWCVLLLPILKEELAKDAADTHRKFGIGMTLGVAAAAAVIIWERIAFTGLFNFGSGYRVVGAFSGMHIGGAYIEGYLVLALPFVGWLALMDRRWFLRLFGLAVFLLGSYCTMVTYARGGYGALLIGMLVLTAAIPCMKTIVLKPRHAATIVTLFVLLAAVAIPVLQGNYMKGRFSTTQRDLDARAMQWLQALDMMENGIGTTLLGMGSGRYPALASMAADSDARPASYRFSHDAGDSYLELSPGLPLYFEQLVEVMPQQHYRIEFSARASHEDAILGLPVCEKWLLYSATCFTETVKIGDTEGRWKQFSVDLHTTELDRRPWYAARPLKFAMFNAGQSSIGVDNVSMTVAGVELIRNGAFTNRMDHWFFSTDRFESWHFENTWLQLYFEQGVIGLALFLLLILSTVIFSRSRLRDAGFPLPPLVAAICGFLALGTLDSLFDFPRLALLFYVSLAFIFLREQPQRRS